MLHSLSQLVLSLFPGIDLLGRGFEREGFVVVRGPDLIFGQDVRNFHLPAGRFQGIIAGSPCQEFSSARKLPPTGVGKMLLQQFCRLVHEGQPDWFLLENVPAVPSIRVAGYRIQRFNLNALEIGLAQHRLRCFQFGSRDGAALVIARCVTIHYYLQRPAITCNDRRDFATMCELQGLGRDFDLPDWPLTFKKRAVGNGVPVPMAQAVARDRAQYPDAHALSLWLWASSHWQEAHGNGCLSKKVGSGTKTSQRNCELARRVSSRRLTLAAPSRDSISRWQ